jgi:hypothetical protein
MIKLVLTGVWVCAITLAAVYFSVSMATAPAPVAADEKKSALELVKGETITIPIIGNGAVTGYFLGRMSFMINKEMVAGMTLPLTEITTDELFTLLIGNKMIDVTNIKAFDPQGFRDIVKKDMNKRLGGEYVADVLLEQLDYLSKDEAKADAAGAQKKTGTPVNIVKTSAPAEAPAAAPAH